VFNISLL
jgi:methylmalonyl-CoA mutase